MTRWPYALVFALASFAVLGGEGVPKIRFHYSYAPFDRSCVELTGFEIDKAAIEELAGRLDAFRQAWEESGTPLMRAVVAETGAPFRQDDLRATLTLCRFRSMSHPLLINMRFFLKTTSKGEPDPVSMFVALAFHEVLHIYNVDNLAGSKLLEKYKDEPFVVKSHLHLNALLKMAYLKLGRRDELKQIIAKDSALSRPAYKRAWEIVNDIGHEAFVEELKRPRPVDEKE